MPRWSWRSPAEVSVPRATMETELKTGEILADERVAGDFALSDPKQGAVLIV